MKASSAQSDVMEDGKHRKRGDQRRQAIVEAATAIFLESGFSGTSLDRIIEVAGGSRRTIYEHFGSKEGLFSAVLCRCCQTVLGNVNALDLYAMTLRDALTVIGEVFLRSITDPVTVAIYRSAAAEVQRFPEIGDLFYKNGPLKGYARLADYLRSKMADGALRVGDADVMARQFMEMVKSDLHFRCIFYPDFVPGEEEIRKRVAEAVETFMKAAC